MAVAAEAPRYKGMARLTRAEAAWVAASAVSFSCVVLQAIYFALLGPTSCSAGPTLSSNLWQANLASTGSRLSIGQLLDFHRS